MFVLIAGLILFLGTHSVHLFASDWRRQQIAAHGEKRWKAMFSIFSLLGLVLIIWGYPLARMEAAWLWYPPMWTRHLAALLTLPAFILLVATYMPANSIRARLGHPMVLAVKIWAFAHLLANGTSADVLLFGTFLVWAIASFAVSRRRDRINAVSRPAGNARMTAATVVAGLLFWFVFAMYLHAVLIGVHPFR